LEDARLAAQIGEALLEENNRLKEELNATREELAASRDAQRELRASVAASNSSVHQLRKRTGLMKEQLEVAERDATGALRVSIEQRAALGRARLERSRLEEAVRDGT